MMLAFIACLTACSDVEEVGDGGSDGGLDAAAEGGPDAAPDGGHDAESDGGPDAESDSGPDAAADGSPDATETCVDLDRDGYGEGSACIAADCDDAEATVHPGATEIEGDGVDQDCDDMELCYVDGDDDGHRSTQTTASSDIACAGAGLALGSAPADDCDDAEATVHPGATEIVGDAIDQTCDGREVCFVDQDDDGYRMDDEVLSLDAACDGSGEALATAPTGDCDDTDPTRHPGAIEGVADGIDQDCDALELCYVDEDGDGARAASTTTSPSFDCAGTGIAPTTAPLDCADAISADPACGGLSGALCSPFNSVDVCNGYDEDCDATIDEDVDRLWYVDADGDGRGAPSTPTASCAPVAGRAEDTNDCDDSSAAVWVEVTRFVDDDGDGFGTVATISCEGAFMPFGLAAASGDCAPTDHLAFPEAVDFPDDGIDQDCDGADRVIGEASGVFVAPPPLGNDANPGTRVAPLATLYAAHARANAAQGIYVASGTFSGETGEYQLRRSVFGGYSPDFTSRGTTGPTVLQRSQTLYVDGSRVGLEHVTIDSSAAGRTIFAVNAATLVLRDAVFVTSAQIDSLSAVASSRSTLLVDRSVIAMGSGPLCRGLDATGGRLLVTRSVLDVCGGSSPSNASMGVFAMGESWTGTPAYVALVGSVIEVDALGVGTGLQHGISLYGLGTRALVANNTIHVGPGAVSGVGRVRLGIYARGDVGLTARVLLANNLFTFDTGSDATGILTDAFGPLEVRHNDIHFGTANGCVVGLPQGACASIAELNACGFPGCEASSGSISVDPLYADAERRLAPGSACIDAGITPTWLASLYARDIDGRARPTGAAIDIGAFEHP